MTELRRAVPRPGWGNQNARKKPNQLVLYRAVTELHRMLRKGSWERMDVLVLLRLKGIGYHTSQAAAALIGVPSNSRCGRPCLWEPPRPMPKLRTLLDQIERGGRHVGKQARKGRGQLKVGTNENA